MKSLNEKLNGSFDNLYNEFVTLIDEEMESSSELDGKKMMSAYDIAFKLSMMEKENEILQVVVKALYRNCKELMDQIAVMKDTACFIFDRPIIPNKDVNKIIIEMAIKMQYNELHSQYQQKAQTLHRICACVNRFYIPNIKNMTGNRNHNIRFIRLSEDEDDEIQIDSVFEMAKMIWNHLFYKLV